MGTDYSMYVKAAEIPEDHMRFAGVEFVESNFGPNTAVYGDAEHESIEVEPECFWKIPDTFPVTEVRVVGVSTRYCDFSRWPDIYRCGGCIHGALEALRGLGYEVFYGSDNLGGIYLRWHGLPKGVDTPNPLCHNT